MVVRIRGVRSLKGMGNNVWHRTDGHTVDEAEELLRANGVFDEADRVHDALDAGEIPSGYQRVDLAALRAKYVD